MESAAAAQQLDYYRARAGEYDEWWFRTGRYDRGDDANAAWFAEVASLEAALERLARAATCSSSRPARASGRDI